MTTNEREGLRLLGVYTADKFTFWSLAGRARASCRAHIMGALLGRRATQAESGVFALQREFERLYPVKTCRAAWEHEFGVWAKAQLAPVPAGWDRV